MDEVILERTRTDLVRVCCQGDNQIQQKSKFSLEVKAYRYLIPLDT